VIRRRAFRGFSRKGFSRKNLCSYSSFDLLLLRYFVTASAAANLGVVKLGPTSFGETKLTGNHQTSPVLCASQTKQAKTLARNLHVFSFSFYFVRLLINCAAASTCFQNQKKKSYKENTQKHCAAMKRVWTQTGRKK
jgi:hypothetical protein